MTNDKPVRYQHCPWYVRLWRRRWYLTIPRYAVSAYFSPWYKSSESNKLAHDMPYNSWKLSWSLAIGHAQGKMHWHYTWEEVKERLETRRKDKK